MNFPQPSFQKTLRKKSFIEVEHLNRRSQESSMDEVIGKSGKQGSVYVGNLESALNIQLLKQKKINYVLTLGSNIKIDYRKRIKQYENKSREQNNNTSSCSSISNESNSSNNNNPQFKVQTLTIDVDDQQYSDLSKHFNRTQQFICNARQKGNVLVHCMMGISRSATVVIAYLMQTARISHQKAFQMVKQKRDCVHPNKGFTRQLNELENHLQNNTHDIYNQGHSIKKEDQ